MLGLSILLSLIYLKELLFFSTVSTGVNSLAAIWYAEMEGTTFKKNLSDYQSGLTVKALALFFGIVSYGLVYVVPYLGGLAQVNSLNLHVSSKLTCLLSWSYLPPAYG